MDHNHVDQSDLISDTESIGSRAEMATEEEFKDALEHVEYDPEEFTKAEEFKEQGNTFFKRKSQLLT